VLWWCTEFDPTTRAGPAGQAGLKMLRSPKPEVPGPQLRLWVSCLTIRDLPQSVMKVENLDSLKFLKLHKIWVNDDNQSFSTRAVPV
jgi:acyl dehydratase